LGHPKDSSVADSSVAYLRPEAKARVEIDRMLAAAGWAVQDSTRANLGAARGVALREFVLTARAGLTTCSSSTAVPWA